MTTDILVKFHNFDPLQIELVQSQTGAQYKELVRKHSQEPAVFRDPCRYTVDYLKSMVPAAKELLGWDWSSDNYLNWETTHRLHKDLEVMDQTTGWKTASKAQQDLIMELHHCLHSVELDIGRPPGFKKSRGSQLQVEWFTDDGFVLPDDFEFTMGWEFGAVRLQYPHVGAPPYQIYVENNWDTVAQSCRFADTVRPGIPIMLEPCRINFDQEAYLAWYKTHGSDFLSQHGEEKLLHYTGWPTIGQVTNLAVLEEIKATPLLELESVQVV